MPDPSPKRRRLSSPKSPDWEAANPETPLNSFENESNYDIGETGGPTPALAANGVDHDVKVYPAVSHSFMNHHTGWTAAFDRVGLRYVAGVRPHHR